jgi:aspartate carbamoyltransferase catalytic subunit
MVDCIVMRHYEPGSSQRASQVCPVAIINGGDGANEHPTQALSDLWTMHTHLGTLDGVRVGLVGDVGTRTLRSIVIGLSRFKPKEIIFLLPPAVDLPKDIISILSSAQISYQLYQDISDVLKDAEVVEILPIHLPNLESDKETNTNKNFFTPECYRITKEKIIHTKSSAFILHPGPRLDELSRNMDLLPQTLFFKQINNSISMRMILLEEAIKASTK